MNVTIPNFPQACLASDDANSAVYLVGVQGASLGRLEAYRVSVSNIDSPQASYVGQQISTDSWTSNSEKACFSYPKAGQANSSIIVFQFGLKTSYVTVIEPDGTIEPSSYPPGASFMSSRLFAFAGSLGSFDMFTVFTNFTIAEHSSPWEGFRLNLTNYVQSNQLYSLPYYPTSTPLLAVGTILPSSLGLSQGFSVVFDTQGQGLAYPVEASSAPAITGYESVMVLGSPLNVNMNSISLTKDAIPITMTSTGYILDKASDGSTVIYSITPNELPRLQRVSNNNTGAPVFSEAMAATALNKQIVTYSPSINGTPTFNSFDTVTGKWSGRGLVNFSGPAPSLPLKTSVGAIVGGVLGGLVVGAFVVFFGIRYSRRGYRTAGSVSNLLQSSDESNKPDESDLENIPLGIVHQHADSYVPPPLQVNLSAVSYEAHQPMSYEFNSIEPIPYVRSPHYVSSTSFRKSTAAGSNPQYVDVKTLISMQSGTPSSPQYVSPGQSLGSPHSTFSTPASPQRYRPST
ncbi:hypothetical protein BGZ98_003859 [Dissophora globulifera]|nr:hypothetical protein BGZ98_003859 [Dissophora globulifera]